MKDVPLTSRTTYQSTSVATGIPMTVLHRIFKNKGVHQYSSSVKPVLTEANKLAWIQYAIGNINLERRLFDSMMDVVHVDEKWFFMKEPTKTFFLAKGEPEPHQTAKSKRFIGKVVFLAAVARPRWDTSRNRFFYGKLGIWPFIMETPRDFERFLDVDINPTNDDINPMDVQRSWWSPR